MADPRKRSTGNVAGEFFVDTTCIDCDTCRQLAPATFEDGGEHSFVAHQPQSESDVRAALRALIACPTGSIGTLGRNEARAVREDFPLEVLPGVSYLGYASADSFGASSYLIERADGNWMVDSPRFITHLVERIEERGGLAGIFLTHQDDVADAARFAQHFRAQRVIHRGDLRAQRDAEIVIDGLEPRAIGDGLVAVPTPGHTRGSMSLHVRVSARESVLFSGDHLWWSRPRSRLWASRDVCWYDWKTQIESIERLKELDFSWILPGHGERRHLGVDVMRAELERLVADSR